jgi:hypothetical protein
MTDDRYPAKLPLGRIIVSRKDLNYWLEYKEAFVLRRWFLRIPDDKLFPVMIIQQIEKDDQLDNSDIKYYLLELDDIENKESESIMKYLESIGFFHICYSKDDLPIFIFQNKII